jgi:hypothetical protein
MATATQTSPIDGFQDAPDWIGPEDVRRKTFRERAGDMRRAFTTRYICP